MIMMVSIYRQVVCNFTLVVCAHTGPIAFSFDQDVYTVSEKDEFVEICVTPNKSVLCFEGPDSSYSFFLVVHSMDKGGE